MDKNLRLVAAKIVVESKLRKSSKLQLLTFIEKEATDPQIKALLMDGKIVTLDEQAIEIVNDRFKTHHMNNEKLIEGAFKTILGMILLSPSGWALWRSLKAAFSEKQRRCGVFGVGAKRDACLIAAKVEMAKRTINLLKKESGNCAKAKKPDKCKAAITKQIAKHTEIIKNSQAKLSKLTQKGKSAAVAAGHEKAKRPEAKLF